MKVKIVISSFLAGLLIFGCIMALRAPSVAAQQYQGQSVEDRWDPANISRLYYISIPIEKVYPYRLGYVVVFRQGLADLTQVYIPYNWRNAENRKLELIQLGTGNIWPYMTVFYREGEFYKVRLHLARSYRHETWGHLPSTVNLDSHFEGVESIDLSQVARH